MDKGTLCASLAACLLLLTLIPGAGRAAAANSDAYFVLDEFSDRPVKGGESASYDYLEVQAVVHVNVSGVYNLTARLEYLRSEISRTYNSTYLSPGTHTVLLRFPNQDIYAAQAVGDYIVQLSLRTPGYPLDPIEEEYTTGFYHFSDFNPTYIAPYPPGSEFSFTDGANLTVQNTYIVFGFEKSRARMSFHFAKDKDGQNGRFAVTYSRVLGYLDNGDSFFQQGEITHSAALANGTWVSAPVEKGIHRAYGPYLRFNITYTVDMVDLRLGTPVAVLEATFSFYMTGNPHPSADSVLTIAGSTQIELRVTLSLSHIIGGSGLVLEQVAEDTSHDHDFLLRDAIGEFRYGEGDVRRSEQKLNPLPDESIAKLAFINRWEPVVYGRYTWITAARSSFGNLTVPATTDVSFIPEGKTLRLFLAYHIKDPKASFLVINDTFAFGLEGTRPPPPRPVKAGPAPHDPLLYVLGSILALAIIYLSMSLRSRAYVEEADELERIEEQELGAPPEEEAPLSIEEKAIGEEDEARRRWAKKETEPDEGPPADGAPPGEGGRAGKDDGLKDGEDGKPGPSGKGGR
jgi:hypothetical protein